MRAKQGVRTLLQPIVSASVAGAMIALFVMVGGFAPAAGTGVVLADEASTRDDGGSSDGPIEERPGYGCGDTNHEHTGAPGQEESDRESPCEGHRSTETSTADEDDADEAGVRDDRGESEHHSQGHGNGHGSGHGDANGGSNGSGSNGRGNGHGRGH